HTPHLLLSCVIIDRGPPSPTRFPYTTLFRSPLSAPAAGVRADPGGRRHRGADARRPARQQRVQDRLRARPSLSRRPGLCEAAQRDRKSTRLNSSHVKISYAVFCLKKKKEKKP